MPKVTTGATVKNVNGFHVRPSTAIAKEAIRFQSQINLFKTDSDVPIDAKSSLDIISSFIVRGDQLMIQCDGPDAEEALVRIKEMVEAIYDYQDPHPVQP